jgi:lactobin A/cerein 7B family class IIb bacteriocin
VRAGLDKLEHSPQPKQRSSIVTTTFNVEMNKQIRELTADEIEAVSGGIVPLAAAILILGLGVWGFNFGNSSASDAIDWQGAAARGQW